MQEEELTSNLLKDFKFELSCLNSLSFLNKRQKELRSFYIREKLKEEFRLKSLK